MQRFWPTLRASYAYGTVGLLVGTYLCSVAFALEIAVDQGMTLRNVLVSPLTGLVITIFALGYGVLPAALVGIPAYAVLRYKHWDSYWTALLIGVASALLVAVLRKPSLADLFAGYGAMVGLLTHQTARTASAWAVRADTKNVVASGKP